eukprot:421992-Amphidinium_carterae.2
MAPRGFYKTRLPVAASCDSANASACYGHKARAGKTPIGFKALLAYPGRHGRNLFRRGLKLFERLQQ